LTVKISVVVPAFNEERLLFGTLCSIRAALTAFEARGWMSELIVCDNNSTDRTAEIARSAGAVVVFEPINQISRARNAGAAQADGDWLVFVDADSQPSLELFADTAAAIACGRCIAGGCTVMLDTDQLAARLFVSVWNSISRICGWAAGSFVFCEASAFRQVGGFSQEIYAAEEIDLSRRLKRLARERGRALVILHRHPLATSGRKARLYAPREYVVFLLRVLMSGGRVLRERDACYPWYDGRR
jgi:glycosyltransferase involved in cell wall biosynthesis